MRVLGRLTLASLVPLVALVPTSGTADEAKCDHVITSAGYTISTQGHYCLGNDIATAATTGAAITINANSVVLDLQGYKIGGQAAGAGTTTYGVYVPNHSTVVVKNGLIRGFLVGVYFEDSGGSNNNLVENIRADGNTNMAIWFNGGDNNTVRDCVVGNTGGSTANATGWVSIAIYLYNTTTSFAINNTVTNTQPLQGVGNTNTFGIYGYGAYVINNNVIGNGNSPATAFCLAFSGASFYRDNTVSACGTNYSGGTNAGGNYP
jgi:hypothetical protein